MEDIIKGRRGERSLAIYVDLVMAYVVTILDGDKGREHVSKVDKRCWCQHLAMESACGNSWCDIQVRVSGRRKPLCETRGGW